MAAQTTGSTAAEKILEAAALARQLVTVIEEAATAAAEEARAIAAAPGAFRFRSSYITQVVVSRAMARRARAAADHAIAAANELSVAVIVEIAPKEAA